MCGVTAMLLPLITRTTYKPAHDVRTAIGREGFLGGKSQVKLMQTLMQTLRVISFFRRYIDNARHQRSVK
jgi:hypothetical protein